MGRYTNIKVIRDKGTKKRKFVSVIYPRIPKMNSDVYIRAREGDRLDNLAFKFYNDVEKWWIIAQANHIGKGTLAIEPGIQVRIPVEIQDIINEFVEMNEDNGYYNTTNRYGN